MLLKYNTDRIVDMRESLKISVITPSFNSGQYIECAIKSVLKQNYKNFEHIIIDGESTDGTINILRKYPHLTWLSEADDGQSDAMNKGFKLSNGQIIVYLNADDYFEKGAFQAVIPLFLDGAVFVVGQVRVIRDNGSSWINDPKTDFREMLEWWRKDAFCFNPVGYFYKREVQESIGGFDLRYTNIMDYDFLLKCAYKYSFVKIDQVLGSFRNLEGTKTAKCKIDQHYENKIELCSKYAILLDDEERNKYFSVKAKKLLYLKFRIAMEESIKDLKIAYKNHNWTQCLRIILKIFSLAPGFLFYLTKKI